ncbi:hypothetical protein Pfo_028473 [Paulownia fortunei]|nr:hypothetical protein Pfo_028473 [Paulownia fortunei]
MQKGIETTSMPPQNPSESIQETESNQATHFPELEKPFSSKNSSESKKSKPEESTNKSHETVDSLVPNKTWEEEEEDTCASTLPTENEGVVEDSSSGRERLKRHRVEVAGRVWIPDMWGQENFLKDWIDCAAFDASLVNSSIMSARDSLVEEGRRANSTRLRI